MGPWPQNSTNTIPRLPVSSRTPCRCWDIKRAALWFVWSTSVLPIYVGPKETYVEQDSGSQRIYYGSCFQEWAEASTFFFLSSILKAHLLYHLRAALTREGLPLLHARLLDLGRMSSTCDFQYSFVYTRKGRQSQGEWPTYPLLLTALAWLL